MFVSILGDAGSTRVFDQNVLPPCLIFYFKSHVCVCVFKSTLILTLLCSILGDAGSTRVFDQNSPPPRLNFYFKLYARVCVCILGNERTLSFVRRVPLRVEILHSFYFRRRQQHQIIRPKRPPPPPPLSHFLFQVPCVCVCVFLINPNPNPHLFLF